MYLPERLRARLRRYVEATVSGNIAGYMGGFTHVRKDGVDDDDESKPPRVPLLMRAAPRPFTKARNRKALAEASRAKGRGGPRPEQSEPTPDPAKHYLAVNLTPASREHLLKILPPKFANVLGHHVTLDHAPSEDLIHHFKKKLVGKQVNFHVTGNFWDDKIGAHAAGVKGLEQWRPDNAHVTISTSPGVQSVHSNEVVRNKTGNRLPNWIPLTGSFAINPKLAV